MRVLIVEDDAPIGVVMKMVLENGGHHAVVIDEDVLPAARKFKPDVILLDYLLPLVDGKHVLHSLCADSYLSNIPVVLVSAHGDARSVAERAGVLFLAKPFKISGLLDVVKTAAARHYGVPH